VELETKKMTKYQLDDTKRYLGFLSDRMKQNELVRFELVDMQYEWIDIAKQEFWIAVILQSIYFFLLGGLIFGLLFGLYFIPLGLLIGVLLRVLFEFLLRVLFFGLIGSTLGVVFFGPFGIILGILLGILFSNPLKGLLGRIDHSSSFLIISHPYQRFHVSFYKGNIDILNHFHLRRILRRRGYIPKDWVRFLQTATEHHILESDGGSWRFRHRILQDYFLEHWRETVAKEK
jgi:hypothetical protein